VPTDVDLDDGRSNQVHGADHRPGIGVEQLLVGLSSLGVRP